MRALSMGFRFAVLLGGIAPCFAQQPGGPATFGNRLESDVKNGLSAAPTAKTPGTGAKHPHGVMVRPMDSVQRPDLDKAWAAYDASVAKATKDIEAAITKQFDAVTGKGDLDAAEKWQAIRERFENAGEIPTATESKAAVGIAVADFKKAREELEKVYEAVVKALTREKKIAEAKAVREELRALGENDNGHGDKAENGDAKLMVNLAREGTPSASRERPGNGAVSLAFDGVTRDTDANATSYWYAGDDRPQPDWLRTELKRVALITQVRFLVPVGTSRFINGHEPVDYEVFAFQKGRRQSLQRVEDARHPKVEPLAGKQNARWIVIDLPKPITAEAVVIAVERTSGRNMGPVVFEVEVMGHYLSTR